MASIRKRSWKTSRGEPRTAWTVDFADPSGHRSRQQFPTKRAADAFRIEVEGQIRGGSFRPEANRITIAEAAALWLEHLRGRMVRGERMGRTTYGTLAGHVRNHILTPQHGLGALKLSQLTARTVSGFRDGLRNSGASVPVTRKVIATLALILDHAISLDLLAVNTARRVRVISRSDEVAKKVHPPSKDALRRVLASADEDFRVCIIFAAATGLRASEQWALRWRDINLDKGEVIVAGRVDQFGGYEAKTKTKAGTRIVPLGNAIVSSLKAWRLRSRFSRPDDVLFPNNRGRYRSHSNTMKREWRPVLEAAHVQPIGWHSLRHFAVSTWIEARLAPKVVQTLAGHSSLSVTMDRYGHMFPSDDHRKTMDLIAQDLA